MNVGVRLGPVLARSMASLLAIATVGLLQGVAPVAGGQQGAASAVTVQTVPPLAGVEVQLGEERGVTGPDGSVTLSVVAREEAREQVVVHTRELAVHDRSRARYSRVMGTNGGRVQLAFDVDYAVNLSFVDRAGAAVEPGLIESLTIKSALGERRVVERVDETMWLHGSRVISTATGPQVRPILWSIEDVSVSGASVVHRAANRFEPAVAAPTPIELLFFSADFTVRDALLGTVAGTSVDLSFPNGQIRQYSLDAEGRVRIDRLPRGDYHIVVNGSGPVLSRPVSITRDQQVELKFYTWNDVSLAVVVLAFCIGGPIALGGWLRRRRRSTGNLLDLASDDQRVIDLVTMERAMSAKRPGRDKAESQQPDRAAGITSDESPTESGGRRDGAPEHDYGDAQWWHVHSFRVASRSRRRLSRRGPWVIAALDELNGHCLAARVTRRRGERELMAVIDEALAGGGNAEPALPVVVFLPGDVGSMARLSLAGGHPTHVELRYRYRAESEITSLQHWQRCVEEEVEKTRAALGEGAFTRGQTGEPFAGWTPVLAAAIALHNMAYPDSASTHGTSTSPDELISSAASAGSLSSGDPAPTATPGR